MVIFLTTTLNGNSISARRYACLDTLLTMYAGTSSVPYGTYMS